MYTESHPNPNRSTGLIFLAMEQARALVDHKRVAAFADRDILQDLPLIHATAPSPEIDTSDQYPLAGEEKRKRQIQHVVPMQEKLKIVKWMIPANTEDMRFLFRRTLDQFSECLRAASLSANLMEVSRG